MERSWDAALERYWDALWADGKPTPADDLPAPTTEELAARMDQLLTLQAKAWVLSQLTDGKAKAWTPRLLEVLIQIASRAGVNDPDAF